jgi:N-acylglucosamine 2-epimerase
MSFDLVALAAESRRQCLEEVLPWWFRFAVDNEYGGVLSMVSDTGERHGTDKFVWSQARWLWVMSAAANRLEPRPEFTSSAAQTANFLQQYGRHSDGRWHYRLSREGAPIEGPISIYSDFFAVYGLSEYYRLSSNPEALATAVSTFEHLCARLESPQFHEIAPYPLEPGQRVFGTHMMLVEIANELSITLGGSSAIDAIAGRAADRMLHSFRQPDSGLIVEYLSRNYSPIPAPQGTLVIPGNAIEGMWFLAHFAHRTGRRELLPAITEATLRHLEFGWDPRYGGVLLNCDLHGGTPYLPHADKKVWWPHVEALYTLALLSALQPEDHRLREWLQRIHQWAYVHFPIPGGEWRQRLDRAGEPVTEVIALPVKDPFHLPRTLILLGQLRRYS